jgi:hypothetical protein
MLFGLSDIAFSVQGIFISRAAKSGIRDEKKKLLTYLFLFYFMIVSLNSAIVPIKDSLVLPWGKSFRSTIMLTSPISSMIGQILISSGTAKYGPSKMLTYLMYALTVLLLCTALSSVLSELLEVFFTVLLTIYVSVSTIATISVFW